MMRLLLLIACVSMPFAGVSDDVGRRIYLEGVDANGQALKAIVNNLETSAPLACANCHRESGLGTSESGLTIPPVSWRFLGQNQPADKHSRFYSRQNKRPAYTAATVHRLLTRGIDSKGELADPLMPRYQISKQQTGQLVEYLATLFSSDDPGVDDASISIATVVDSRLSENEKKQHLEFLKGLFGMKNALTRGELKRKKYAPFFKAPQYQAYRKWDLSVWELPEDTSLWRQELMRLYQARPVFFVLAPLVKDNYPILQAFCSRQQLPCMLPHRSDGSKGDYYNFVYQDLAKLRKDYLNQKRRAEKNKLVYLDDRGEIARLDRNRADIPIVNSVTSQALAEQYSEICVQDNSLMLKVDRVMAERILSLDCPGEQKLRILLFADSSLGYRGIEEMLDRQSSTSVCWVTNYDKVLKANYRATRVNVLARKFDIDNPEGEILARDLFAFGLLGDALFQLAGNFSRAYLLEIVEHMLNSSPNYTYYSSLSGAPNQRAIVGPYKEFCPTGEASA